MDSTKPFKTSDNANEIVFERDILCTTRLLLLLVVSSLLLVLSSISEIDVLHMVCLVARNLTFSDQHSYGCSHINIIQVLDFYFFSYDIFNLQCYKYTPRMN